MNNNVGLKNAKTDKFDEFYTLYENVANECQYYEEFFAGKVIYCPCDDPKWSSFVKYFRDNFDRLRLKRLISTHYGSKEVHEWFCNAGHTVHEMYPTKVGLWSIPPVGSFCDDYCVSLMDEADIVVTNPPFSKWTAFVRQMLKHNVDFLIVGTHSKLARVEFVKEYVSGKIHSGCTDINWFAIPNEFVHKFTKGRTEQYEYEALANSNLNTIARVGDTLWYTTLNHGKERPWLKTGVKYEEGKYTKDIFTGCLNINRAKDIPDDYYGEMGVPVSFFEKLNYNQFELLDIRHELHVLDVNGKVKRTYSRIIIKRK